MAMIIMGYVIIVKRNKKLQNLMDAMKFMNFVNSAMILINVFAVRIVQ